MDAPLQENQGEDKKPENTPDNFNGGRPFLLICITEKGDASVGGWFSDKPLAYSILEMARDEIKNWHDKNEFRMRQEAKKKPGIIIPSILGFKRNGNGKH